MSRRWEVGVTIGVAVTITLSVLIVIQLNDSRVPVNHIINSSGALVGAGSILYISDKSEKINSGLPGQPSYYCGEFNFSVSSLVTLSGNWTSTSKSVMFVTGNSQVWAELPVPYYRSGNLNQTLGPGDYSLTYGGSPGDSIHITKSIKLTPLAVKSISTLIIPDGTMINATASIQEFNFSIQQNGTIVGSFTSLGAYTVTIENSDGSSGFSMGVSGNAIYKDVPIGSNLQPGNYTLSFIDSIYEITSTVEVLNTYN